MPSPSDGNTLCSRESGAGKLGTTIRDYVGTIRGIYSPIPSLCTSIIGILQGGKGEGCRECRGLDCLNLNRFS